MQIYIFLLCLACGVASGFAYDFLYLIRRAAAGAPAVKTKKREIIVTAVCDVIYALVLSALFVACSVAFSFPDVRLYMFAAVFSGALLYIKSLHIMVAFLVNKLYNRIAESVKCKKARRRRAKNNLAARTKR